jgi:hypothetical protein
MTLKTRSCVYSLDLLDYWHRIVHDVFAGDPPDALVLCIYPGNDFQCVFPDDAFDAEERSLRDYFTKPGWTQHVIAWVNLHSKFGSYAQRALLCIGSRPSLRPRQGPKIGWTDPEVAARAAGEPALRRSRSQFLAIDEEYFRQPGRKSACVHHQRRNDEPGPVLPRHQLSMHRLIPTTVNRG